MKPGALLRGAICAGVFAWATTAMADDMASGSLDSAGYALVATFTVKPDAKAQFVDAMKENISASRKEPGVVLYRSYQKSSDPLIFVNVELYKDKAAFDAHLKTPHVTKIGETFKSILAKDIDVVTLDPLP